MSLRHHRRHFVEFGAHTLCKHRVLQEYLVPWAAKLAQDGQNYERLVLIDAFAGTGGDDLGNPGSPLIMIEAAASAAVAVSRFRTKPRIDVVLIEKDARNRTLLNARVAALSGSIREYIDIRDQGLAEHADDLLKEFGRCPMVVFIDPWGLKGIEAGLVQRFLAGAQREVFVQFNSKAAMRHGAAAIAPAPRRESRLLEALNQGELFAAPETPSPGQDDALYRCRQAFERGRNLSARVLAGVFGSEDSETRLAAGASTGEMQRRAIRMFAEVLEGAGASYISRLPVYNKNLQAQYVLLHASQHPKGRQTMKEAYARAIDTCSLPVEAVRLMRQAAEASWEDIQAAIEARFGGQDASWAKDRPGSLQDFLLRETGAFPWQLPILKQMLDDQRYRLPGKKVVYRLPPQRPVDSSTG